LQEYRPELGFKAYTEVFTVLSPDFIFKVICGACQTHVPGFTTSEDTYKIKGKVNTDEGSFGLNILLTKVDETTTCIEFHKTTGNLMVFYKVIDEIKKSLPTVEVGEEQEQKSESQ